MLLSCVLRRAKYAWATSRDRQVRVKWSNALWPVRDWPVHIICKHFTSTYYIYSMMRIWYDVTKGTTTFWRNLEIVSGNMAYIAMSCVFLFSLVLISSTNSAPVSGTVQEQFFDNYKHTENYLQSCNPTLNVLFDTSTSTDVDPATSAGQPSIFREACPPESSQNQARQHTSNLCMLFAYRIHDMCPLSKAMQNNVNEFNTEMMQSFLQHSQTVMDEQKFCGEMTAAPPQGQKSITLSQAEAYYISRAAGVQVAGPLALPLDPSTCSLLWKSMGCDRRELNSICQAYAFLATIEGE